LASRKQSCTAGRGQQWHPESLQTAALGRKPAELPGASPRRCVSTLSAHKFAGKTPLVFWPLRIL